jgi:hypothetical protein
VRPSLQVRDKEELLNKASTIEEAAGAHKRQLDDSLSMYKDNNNKLQVCLAITLI